MVLKPTVQNQSSKGSLPKDSLKKLKSNAELWTVISNQMIKHQLSHMLFHQINGHNHNTCMERYPLS